MTSDTAFKALDLLHLLVYGNPIYGIAANGGEDLICGKYNDSNVLSAYYIRVHVDNAMVDGNMTSVYESFLTLDVMSPGDLIYMPHVGMIQDDSQQE